MSARGHGHNLYKTTLEVDIRHVLRRNQTVSLRQPKFLDTRGKMKERTAKINDRGQWRQK